MVSVTEKYVSNNFRDAAEKMNGVVANYRGDWIYLSNWRRDCGSADVAFLDNEKINNRKVIDFSTVDAAEFSFGPYPLGFCVVDNDLFYVSRDPVRKNRFGLREDNMAWTRIVVEDPDNQLDGRAGNPFGRSWRSGAFYNMLTGKYTGLRGSVKAMTAPKVMFSAINRDFALVRIGLRLCALYYKTDQVGEVDLPSGEIALYPSFDHLKERVDRTVKET